jgi:hypothetical protein
MADPVLIDITPANHWVLVAQNVQSGQLFDKKTGKNYVFTTRDTGNPAPPDTPLTDQAPLFDDTTTAVISSSFAIDVYVMCLGDVGRIMAVLP